MLSIGKLTVEQSRYYERQVAQGRDDYYSGRGESPGRWTGSGADSIGIGGRVDDDGFMALVDGRDPGTGERLKRVGGRSKVAAFDLTFSAPKSVSVLFAIGEPALAAALVEAHESAVDAALGYLEREACRVRRGRGGVRREVGEGFVAAAYRHRMSRAEDPQLHTHVVAADMARGADGRWTALDATPIYQHAKAAGFLYQAHLRAAVRERLPWVRWGPVRNGMAEIEQLSPVVLREFSTRRREIVERERELVAAGVQVGDGGREAIAHDTRGRKRYGVDTGPWRDVVRARAAEHGLGARELAALVLGPAKAPEVPDPQLVGGELTGAAGLTQKQNTFAKREAVMAWAAAHGQGAPAAAVEREARDGRLGESVHVGGDEFAVGDRVVARRNDRERAVDNGMRGTVIAVDPTEKDVVVRTDAGARRRLDATYVADHLQHAYALTAHTIQGATVEWAGVVGRPEDFTRNWSYTALSRAREPTELFLIDTPTERELDRAEIALGQARGLRDERTPIKRLEAAMRQRDDEDLALDRIDTERNHGPAQLEPTHARLLAEVTIARPSVGELQAELKRLRERIGSYPEHLVDQLHAARRAQTEAQYVADEARARIAELEQPAQGVVRRRAPDSAERGRERQRLKLAEGEIAAATERERNLASSIPDRDAWDAERRALRERAAEIDTHLSSRRREHLRLVLERPARYLTEALGALPEQPRARRTWQQAAKRIEAYRFDHAITDTRHALGSPPSDHPERAQWQRAHHDLQRAQRDLGHHNTRQHSREI